MAAILDLCKKTNFASLDFSRLLVCYSRDLSDHKIIEKPSVAICGGSFSILTGLITKFSLKRIETSIDFLISPLQYIVIRHMVSSLGSKKSKAFDHILYNMYRE